jgi:hypothetical protein
MAQDRLSIDEGLPPHNASEIKVAIQTKGPPMQGLIRIPGGIASNFDTGKGMTVVDLINVGNNVRGYADIVALEVRFTQAAPGQTFWVLTVDYVDGMKGRDGSCISPVFVSGFRIRNSRAEIPIFGHAQVRVLHPDHRQAVPSSPDWFPEVKCDGYRLPIERYGQGRAPDHKGRIRLNQSLPWIAEAALKNRRSQFVTDDEAVILGVGGISNFNALHPQKQNAEVQLRAFDVLAIDGEDVCALRRCHRRRHCRKVISQERSFLLGIQPRAA